MRLRHGEKKKGSAPEVEVADDRPRAEVKVVLDDLHDLDKRRTKSDKTYIKK